MFDRRLPLQIGEDLLRFRLWQLPERTAVLVDLGEKGPDFGVDPWVGGGIGRAKGGGL